MKTQRPMGTYDLTPADTSIWAMLEERIRAMFTTHNYGEIRTPMFEYTELFQRGVGESSDIVTKEMYTFMDRGDRSLTLRPEGTAAVVRAYLENGLANKIPGAVKLWYFAPMFRYERKQRGRYRQHVQYGCEIFGAPGPEIDVELLVMLNRFYHSLGLTELDLKINSVGTPECRPAYREALLAHVQPHLDAGSFCEDCQRRATVNPMRMFDCKVESCQALLEDAPLLIDHLDDDAKQHFEGVKSGLDAMCIQYSVDTRLVRGLDYYTKTAFEMSYAPLGSQGVLMGGGRYDGLIDFLGGPATPGIGFGAGMERLVLILKETGKLDALLSPPAIDLFVTILGEAAEQPASQLLADIRSLGFRSERDYTGKSMRKQMQLADKLGARFAVMIGENEVNEKKLVLKSLHDGNQQELPWSVGLEELVQALRDE